MFFARRRRHSLFSLILMMLGLRCVCRRHRGQVDDATREEYRGKARQFRSKLKEAFAVWDEEPAPAAAPEAPTEPNA